MRKQGEGSVRLCRPVGLALRVRATTGLSATLGRRRRLDDTICENAELNRLNILMDNF